MTVQVNFRLMFGTRKDEDAAVHVGYCPLLNLYSQGETQDEAEAAIVDAAQLFIVTCYERDNLHRILRDHGMNRASAPATHEEKKQFIAISEIDDYERQFERDVPIDLLVAAAAQGSLACQ